MVLDDEYGEFEMNGEFVSSVDFVGNLIDLDLIWNAKRIFRKNHQPYDDYESKIIQLAMQGTLEFSEAEYRLYDYLCECIGEYTPIPTVEFAAILAPLRAEQYESVEAYEALLQPLEAWVDRMSRLAAMEMA